MKLDGGHTFAITGGDVITTDAVIHDGVVVVDDGCIAFVGRREEAEASRGSVVVDARGKYVCPGLIDTHVHGSHGEDVMSAGIEGIKRISRAQTRYGTTAYLPTTVTANRADTLGALESCAGAAEDRFGTAEIVGVHLEGPFINRRKKGAQPADAICDPEVDSCLALLDAVPGLVRMMTIAPELPSALEVIRLLTARGVVASLGHTEADYATSLAAVEAGASHATHLFNAMPPLHHRAPNVTTACLIESDIRAEIVLDGFHVAPESARLAFAVKGRDGLILVTDGVAAVGCPDGTYALGENTVRIAGGRCTLLDGPTIAGSVLTMNRAIRNAVVFMRVPLFDAVYMASFVPALVCGVSDRKGSLAPGKDADIAILNPDFTVFMTICRGVIAYRSDA
jgi:N-acetylglucosamine-6-phosphate deacetylase